MNRFLFDTLTFINGFLAVIIIITWTVLGYFHPNFASARPVGLVLGLLAGITIAAIVCGTLAFLALIERHLRTIAERSPAGGTVSHTGTDSIRREPSL